MDIEVRGQPPAQRGLPSGLYALRAGSGPGGRSASLLVISYWLLGYLSDTIND